METQLTRKNQKQVRQVAAAHQNPFSKERSGFFLEDNRESSTKQQRLIDRMHAANVIQKKPNNTGLPDNLKSGIENLSGHSLDDVKVHYNSAKPAQLDAHAYAQGTNIHIASGQEKHLPHEAWHVVQQKQGRVQPTTSVNGAKVNDSTVLEKEADVMGTKALQRKATTIKPSKNTYRANVIQLYAVIQLKKQNAINFIKKQNLGIEATHVAVQAYVQNTDNDKKLRLGLLNSWNYKQTGTYTIATPDDLIPKSTDFTTMDDLADYDSEDDDDMDLDAVMESKTEEKMDLSRVDSSRDRTGVPVFNPFDSVRFGRQVNKRGTYDRIPMATRIGGHYIEYDNPGTKDIYATPLELTGKKGVRKTYKRQGTSSDYNWDNLAKKLEAMGYDDHESRLLNILRFYLRKGSKMKMDPATAEAIAAIGSDFMKGSKGARFYLLQVIRNIKRSKKTPSFHSVFSGKNPLYLPAATGGRGKVSEMNEQIELIRNELLGVNNCLINAIALAAHLPLPNLGQLLRIREQIGSVGEMLLASDENIAIIRQVLGIQDTISIIYQDRESEDFAGSTGHTLLIYHVNENHFTHIMPH
ncbi:MAG: DUF4157 domain-containing protein [Bacteroidota bacterium]